MSVDKLKKRHQFEEFKKQKQVESASMHAKGMLTKQEFIEHMQALELNTEVIEKETGITEEMLNQIISDAEKIIF